MTAHSSGPASDGSEPESISIGTPEESDSEDGSDNASEPDESTSMGSGRCPVSATRYS